MFREYLGTYNKKSVFGNVISKTYNEVQMYTDNLASYIIDKNLKKFLYTKILVQNGYIHWLRF